MRNLISTSFIYFFVSVNGFSNANDFTINEDGTIKPNSKPMFKISERKILKNQETEEVSNFSMEELRLGAQRPLNNAEIQYFKSQCRYAFMSDKDIIANHCEAKKVSVPK
ncbi:TPA: hypothetical protein ACK3JR_000770 [Mannheimia haemolytica]